MRNRFFIPLVLIFALVAAACGSTAETVSDGIDEATEAVEEVDATDAVVEEDVPEEPAEITTEAPETTTEAPAEETTTEAPVAEAPAEETTAEAPTEAPAAEVPAAAIDGQALYEANCTRCHASDGSGGRGPSLQGIATEQPDQSAGINQVVGGGGGMPAFGATLNAEEIQATIDYIWDTF